MGAGIHFLDGMVEERRPEIRAQQCLYQASQSTSPDVQAVDRQLATLRCRRHSPASIWTQDASPRGRNAVSER